MEKEIKYYILNKIMPTYILYSIWIDSLGFLFRNKDVVTV